MKLYVGTYVKYNRGSIAGGWLDLDKFANKEEFLKACRCLHKGERDPEFMFQDVEFTTGEDWERNYYNESYIDADYWKEAAEARARRAAEAKKPKKVDPVREEYAAQLRAEGEKNVDYYLKEADVVVKLTGGEFFAIEKMSIETSFCAGENEGLGGPTVAEAESRCDYFKTERGFKRKNMRRFDDEWFFRVARQYRHYNHFRGPMKLYGDYFVETRWWRSDKSTKIVDVHQLDIDEKIRNEKRIIRAMNDEDLRRVRSGYAIARKNFKKRLDAYWKRYGASKLRTWTYWTEA